MNWKDITIAQLQELYSIEHFEGIEKKLHTLAIITNEDIDVLEEMTLEDLLKRFERLAFLNELPSSKVKLNFKHLRKRYKLIANAQEMNAHHFIELQQINAENIIENLHKILAMLSYRVDIFNRRVKIDKGKIAQDFEQRCEDFKSLRCDIAYSYAVFSLAVYPLLLNATLSYLKQEMSTLETT